MEAGLAAVQHLLHSLRGIAGDLWGELGGKDHLLTGHVLDEIAQDALGGPLAVDGGGVPQGQVALQRLVKHGTQVILKQMASKHLIPASRAGTPGPRTQRDFRHCIHDEFLLLCYQITDCS